jgi:hypothetical protein
MATCQGGAVVVHAGLGGESGLRRQGNCETACIVCNRLESQGTAGSTRTRPVHFLNHTLYMSSMWNAPAKRVRRSGARVACRDVPGRPGEGPLSHSLLPTASPPLRCPPKSTTIFPSYLECHLRRPPTPHGDDRGQFLLAVPWPGAPITTVLCLSSISVPGRFRVVW